MKVKHSLKGQLERDPNSYLVIREGTIKIYNKLKPKLKVKQKNNKKKRKLKIR